MMLPVLELLETESVCVAQRVLLFATTLGASWDALPEEWRGGREGAATTDMGRGWADTCARVRAEVRALLLEQAGCQGAARACCMYSSTRVWTPT